MSRRRTPDLGGGSEGHANGDVLGTEEPCHMRIVHVDSIIMTNVQVRDVPEAVLVALRGAAAARGESLQRYLLSMLTEQARIDATAAVLAAAAEDARDSAGATFDSAQWVRAARDERGVDLMAQYAQ